MRNFIINEQQLTATLDYLSQRPFHEVEQAIAVLRRLPVLPATDEKNDNVDHPALD